MGKKRLQRPQKKDIQPLVATEEEKQARNSVISHWSVGGELIGYDESKALLLRDEGLGSWPQVGGVRIMDFFNVSKEYSNFELQWHVISLAFILSVIGEDIKKLQYQRQFKNKLKHFLELIETQAQSNTVEPFKIEAFLYILVALIHHSRKTQPATPNRNPKAIQTNQTPQYILQLLLSDQHFLRTLLQLKVPNHPKAGKLYGIVITYITSKPQSKNIREAILKSIFNNLQNINHEPTIFNLLVHLRNQKNKVKILSKDVLAGNIPYIFTQLYYKYIRNYQSFFILDYLNHLMTLFPQLAAQLVTPQLISTMVTSAEVQIMHHPLHENIIISIIRSGLKNLEQPHRRQMLEVILSLEIKNVVIWLKMMSIVIEFQTCQNMMLHLSQRDFFHGLLRLRMQEMQEPIRQRMVQLVCLLLRKIKGHNATLSLYIYTCLSQKRGLMGQRQMLRLRNELSDESEND